MRLCLPCKRTHLGVHGRWLNTLPHLCRLGEALSGTVDECPVPPREKDDGCLLTCLHIRMRLQLGRGWARAEGTEPTEGPGRSGSQSVGWSGPRYNGGTYDAYTLLQHGQPVDGAGRVTGKPVGL